MLEQYGDLGSMRDNPPLWSFRDVPSPSSISISIDGKFAGVGSKSGVVLVNQNGRAVWKNSNCLLYTSPSPRDISGSRMPSSA